MWRDGFLVNICIGLWGQEFLAWALPHKEQACRNLQLEIETIAAHLASLIQDEADTLVHTLRGWNIYYIFWVREPKFKY